MIFSFCLNCHFYFLPKMINLSDITNENNKEHNGKWAYIPDHPYRILIIGRSASGKTNTLLNLIKEQDNDVFIDKIYLYAKYLSEPKHDFFIEKWKNAGTKNLNQSKHIYGVFKYSG